MNAGAADAGAGDFSLDARLAADTRFIVSWPLCDVRLMNDARWPWLVLVPRRDGITEAFELDPRDQPVLAAETLMAARCLKAATGAAKINIGALGNIVSQLHVHVVARTPEDPAWPGPVWGFGGSARVYDTDNQDLIEALSRALLKAVHGFGA